MPCREIFGPILPLVPVADVDEAIAFVNERPHALVLYAFSDDDAVKSKSEYGRPCVISADSAAVLEETTSGNLAFNDTFQQLAVGEIPFCGVGESGCMCGRSSRVRGTDPCADGAQIMKYGFDGFSYMRSTVDIPKE